jgi:hypothetical protein
MEIGGIQGFGEIERILRLLDIKGSKSVSKEGGVKFGLDKAEISTLGEHLLAASIERAVIERALQKLPPIREAKLKEVEKRLADNFYSTPEVTQQLASILSYLI